MLVNPTLPEFFVPIKKPDTTQSGCLAIWENIEAYAFSEKEAESIVLFNQQCRVVEQAADDFFRSISEWTLTQLVDCTP